MNGITMRSVSIVTAACLALAACGGDDDSGTPVSDPSPSETSAPETTARSTIVPATDAPTATTAAPAATEAPATTSASPETTTAQGPEPLVALSETDLGQVIVAADGLTLYMFAPDTEGEPTCTGACAGTWPPYYVEEDAELTAGDGLDPALLGVVAHPDGGNMLRYGDWPLYYYAGDQAPGDTNGQGVNDVWWVVDGSGAPIQKLSRPADDTGYGSYNY